LFEALSGNVVRAESSLACISISISINVKNKYEFGCLRVDISIILVKGDASDKAGCDRRTPEMSNAALQMNQDITSIEI